MSNLTGIADRQKNLSLVIIYYFRSKNFSWFQNLRYNKKKSHMMRILTSTLYIRTYKARYNIPEIDNSNLAALALECNNPKWSS